MTDFTRNFDSTTPVNHSNHRVCDVEPLEARCLLSGVSPTANPAPTLTASAVLSASSTAEVSRQVSITLRAFSGSVQIGSNFYADVSSDAGTPNGLVYFYHDGSPIGAGWVVNGQAWMHSDHLPAGTHNIYAVYAGDADHDRAASNQISHVVTANPVNLAKAVIGRWDWRGNGATRIVGLYAPGAAVVPTGTLVFHNSPTLAGSSWNISTNLDARGQADFGLVDPPDDLQYLYYTYSGDANYPAESSLIYLPAPYTPAAPAPTSIVLGAQKSATNIGQPITLTAALQRPSRHSLSAVYSGTVQFWSDNNYLGSATVDPTGVATFVADNTQSVSRQMITTEDLYVVRAVYSGDATHAGAEAKIWHAVIPSARLTRVNLLADKTTASQDEPITFTARVTDVFNHSVGDQLGWVRLLDEWGKNIAPPVRVSPDGTAVFILHSLPADTYGISASYQGTLSQNGYTPAKSITIPIRITAASHVAHPDIHAKITSISTNRFPAKLTVTLSSSSAAIPTGKVAVYSQADGTLFLGYANLDATGAASLDFSAGMSKFYQKVRIIYFGDSAYAPTEKTISLTPAYGYLTEPIPSGLPATAGVALSIDIDGDATKDLVYRDQQTGSVIIRFMKTDGTTKGIKNLPAVPLAGWSLDTGGDIDGDGHANLLWRNLSTNRSYIWSVNTNGDLVSQGYINAGGVAAGWRMVATGDFNKDNKADIVWSNDLTGQRSVWLMNGTNVRSFAMFNHAPRDIAWIIDSVEDLNNDGNPDLLWRNTQTGGTFGWLLRSTAVIGTIAPL